MECHTKQLIFSCCKRMLPIFCQVLYNTETPSSEFVPARNNGSLFLFHIRSELPLCNFQETSEARIKTIFSHFAPSSFLPKQEIFFNNVRDFSQFLEQTSAESDRQIQMQRQSSSMKVTFGGLGRTDALIKGN